MTSTAFRTRFSDTNAWGRLTVPAALQLIQEATVTQTRSLRDRTWEHLQESGLTWVLASVRVRFPTQTARPRWRDEVMIESWRAGLIGERIARREHRLAGAAGEPAAVAATGWALFSLRERRAVPIPLSIVQDYAASSADHESIMLQFGEPPPRPVSPPELDHERRFEVLASDIDQNRHCNNVRIITWACDSLPLELQRHHQCIDAEIRFRAEVLPGAHIDVRTRVRREAGEHLTAFHTLTRDSDQRVVAEGRTMWERMPEPW
jgi:acyl-CoA thioesterase FadM